MKKQIISLVVCSSMILSITSCSAFGSKSTNTKDVIAAAEAFSDNFISGNEKKIMKGLSDDFDEDTKDQISAMLESSMYVYPDAVDLYFNSISYEVDEDSIEVNKDEAEVKVTYTFADVSDLDTSYDSEEDLCDAIEDLDTTDKTVTLTFILDDDEWLLDKAKKLLDVYEGIAAINLIDIGGDDTFVIGSDEFEPNWWFCDGEDGYYENTSSFDLDVWGTGSLDIEYYEVVYNGSVVYTGTGSDAWVFGSDMTGVELVDDYYIPTGIYTINFYNGEDELLYTADANIVCTIVPDETPTSTVNTPDDMEAYWNEHAVISRDNTDLTSLTEYQTVIDTAILDTMTTSSNSEYPELCKLVAYLPDVSTNTYRLVDVYTLWGSDVSYEYDGNGITATMNDETGLITYYVDFEDTNVQEVADFIISSLEGFTLANSAVESDYASYWGTIDNSMVLIKIDECSYNGHPDVYGVQIFVSSDFSDANTSTVAAWVSMSGFDYTIVS